MPKGIYMKQATNNDSAARSAASLAVQVELALIARGVDEGRHASDARPAGFRSLGTTNHLDRGGRDGLRRTSMKG